MVSRTTIHLPRTYPAFCMVSDVLFQGWDVGTLGNTLSGCVTQDPRVDASEASAIHTTHTNVYGTWTHVFIHKAHFPSSPRSVVLRARRVRVWPARLHAWNSCSVFTVLWCGCSVVKLTFYFHQSPSWLSLVWTNSPVFTPTRV